MTISSGSNHKESFSDLKLKFLDRELIVRIDDMLAAVGDYGEVQLVVQKGELRYINKTTSYKTWDHDHHS